MIKITKTQESFSASRLAASSSTSSSFVGSGPFEQTDAAGEEREQAVAQYELEQAVFTVGRTSETVTWHLRGKLFNFEADKDWEEL
jgi:hypothetical protein